MTTFGNDDVKSCQVKTMVKILFTILQDAVIQLTDRHSGTQVDFYSFQRADSSSGFANRWCWIQGPCNSLKAWEIREIVGSGACPRKNLLRPRK